MSLREDAREFVRLCNQSAKAWEDGNNDSKLWESKKKESDRLAERAEAIATKHGFTCIWPGLYPVLSRKGKDYDLSGAAQLERIFREATR